MTKQAGGFVFPGSIEDGGDLSGKDTELYQALSQVRAILAMAREAGDSAPLQLSGEDIYCLLKPTEERIAKVLASEPETQT